MNDTPYGLRLTSLTSMTGWTAPRAVPGPRRFHVWTSEEAVAIDLEAQAVQHTTVPYISSGAYLAIVCPPRGTRPYVRRPPRNTPGPRRRVKRWTSQEAVAAGVAFVERCGRYPTTPDCFTTLPSLSSVQKHFTTIVAYRQGIADALGPAAPALPPEDRRSAR